MGPRIATVRPNLRLAGAEAVVGGGAAADPLDARLETCNATLAQLGISLRLERRGGRIGLRGPLPLRQGPGRRIQRLSLGLPATAAGLEHALAQLRLVAAQLEVGAFQWSEWSRPCRREARSGPGGEAIAIRGGEIAGQGPGRSTSRVAAGERSGAGRSPAALGSPGTRPPGAAAGERDDEPGSASHRWGVSSTAPPRLLTALIAACERFEHQFFSAPRRRQRAGSRSTWTAAYRPYLRRMLALADDRCDLPLNAELLLRTLESYRPGSSGRQRCASALAALAQQEGVSLPSDWRERSCGYGLHAARFRSLPSDDQILRLVREIPNPGWRLVYGLMATYGLRNHEAFFCDLSSLSAGGDRVVRVLSTSKTGEHQVWPFQPEWVDWFELEQLGRDPAALPPVARDLSRTTLRHAGRRVAEQFRRYDLPITPYDLRHAWAVRTIHIGLPDTVAARMMGHSVAIHTRTYHHWITRRDQQRAVDAALARRQGG
jgi:hypothetical protein